MRRGGGPIRRALGGLDSCRVSAVCVVWCGGCHRLQRDGSQYGGSRAAGFACSDSRRTVVACRAARGVVPLLFQPPPLAARALSTHPSACTHSAHRRVQTSTSTPSDTASSSETAVSAASPRFSSQGDTVPHWQRCHPRTAGCPPAPRQHSLLRAQSATCIRTTSTVGDPGALVKCRLPRPRRRPRRPAARPRPRQQQQANPLPPPSRR